METEKINSDDAPTVIFTTNSLGVVDVLGDDEALQHLAKTLPLATNPFPVLFGIRQY